MLKLDFEEKVLGRHINHLAGYHKFYHKQLPDANQIATAMAYFQRYYLHQTLFQAHPAKIEHIQNASLYLAMKVSEILQNSD